MALVPRPMADPPRRRRVLMRAWVPLALALVAGPALAAIDVDLTRYTAADRAGAAVPVTGRAFAERRKPDGPDTPLVGASVVAFPRSDALLRRLEHLREGARDSANAYREAALLMQRAREAYEREIWDAGAPELVRNAVVDATGRFDLGRLPEGRWIVVAVWDRLVSSKGAKPATKERGVYLPPARLTGYRSRLVWLQEVAVSRADSAALELTDRNVWFTGVVEERLQGAGPPPGRRPR
jgi:hypothetical protein